MRAVTSPNNNQNLSFQTPKLNKRRNTLVFDSTNYYIQTKKQCFTIRNNNRRRSKSSRVKFKKAKVQIHSNTWMFKWFKLHKDYNAQRTINLQKLEELEEEMRLLLDMIYRHVQGWSPLWERHSHTPGDGHCGTLDLESLRLVLARLKYIIILSGYPEELFAILECGCGVLDFAKGLLIGLPRAKLFCFDLKNYFENVFSDLNLLACAIRNLRHMISRSKSMNVKDVGIIHYVFGTAIKESVKFKTFLKDLGAAKQIIDSKCKICVSFWEGWSVRDKTVLLTSATISEDCNVIFCADRGRTMTTIQKLDILNDRYCLSRNKWIVFETCRVRLAHGGDIMPGIFFVRRNMLRNALAYNIIYTRCLPPPQANLSRNKWVHIFKKVPTKRHGILINAMQMYMSHKLGWNYSGYPSRWHIMDLAHDWNAEELKEYAAEAVNAYMTSTDFTSGGCMKDLMRTRSMVAGLSREDQVEQSIRIAKTQMMIVSPNDICKEIFADIDREQLSYNSTCAITPILKVIKVYGCQVCNKIFSQEEVLDHALGGECSGNEDDIIPVADMLDNVVLNETGYDILLQIIVL
eukprot:g6563.t1